MIGLERLRQTAASSKEFLGQRVGDFLGSRKFNLSLAAGNFAASTYCALVAVEADSKPIPNDKLSAMALSVSAIAAVASGINWQAYHDERDSAREFDQNR